MSMVATRCGGAGGACGVIRDIAGLLAMTLLGWGRQRLSEESTAAPVGKLRSASAEFVMVSPFNGGVPGVGCRGARHREPRLPRVSLSSFVS